MTEPTDEYKEESRHNNLADVQATIRMLSYIESELIKRYPFSAYLAMLARNSLEIALGKDPHGSCSYLCNHVVVAEHCPHRE